MKLIEILIIGNIVLQKFSNCLNISLREKNKMLLDVQDNMIKAKIL